MKVLYLECNMGAAGDMLMSALLGLHENPQDFIDRLNKLGIPNVKVEREQVTKCGIVGMGVKVLIDGHEEDEHMHDHEDEENANSNNHEHDHHHEHGRHHTHDRHHPHHHEHHHSSIKEIYEIIAKLNVSEKVKNDACEVYRLLAEAESAAHGVEMEQIHFHEVGTMDAVVDIVGVCMLIHEIAPDKIYSSYIHVGSGTVKCAHGILPVPAPATANILQGVPIYGGEVDGELCTPTGAALLKYFTDKFVKHYAMEVDKIGYGMGKRNFTSDNGMPILSAVRAMIGSDGDTKDEITTLSCNIDDMTGEEIGFATEMLLKIGALDVFTTPIYMKKNRPGVLLSCICNNDEKGKIVEAIFKYTSTIGIREQIAKRYTLKREEYIKNTKYGDVRVKKSYGYGIEKEKSEYDDLSQIAVDNNISLRELNK